MSELVIKSPETGQEWQQYDELAYRVLRAPWNQEPLPREPASDLLIPALALLPDGSAAGVARLEKTGAMQWQLRQMAVAPQAQGKGIGRQLVVYLEERAREAGATEIMMHARENAVGFYKTLGYETVESSYLLFGLIPHFLMRKSIW
jgi:ribosomal protein S18 acetylase RimI-like enzyme